MAPNHSSQRNPTVSAARRSRILPFAVLALLAGVLWGARPKSARRAMSSEAEHTRSCLSNLNRIAVAFMQYAEDYDGKFPRGVDAEDRSQPQTWIVRRPDGTLGDARDLPMLQELLFPYLHDREVWHCPADVGWDEVHLPNVGSTLRNVKPSSFVRYGSSYYYLTKHGFEGWRSVDIDQPNLDAVLFDGDTWHKPDGDGSINVLFADGHVQNLTPMQFGTLPPLPNDDNNGY